MFHTLAQSIAQLNVRTLYIEFSENSQIEKPFCVTIHDPCVLNFSSGRTQPTNGSTDMMDLLHQAWPVQQALSYYIVGICCISRYMVLHTVYT